jgi:hypothetical protein
VRKVDGVAQLAQVVVVDRHRAAQSTPARQLDDG